MTATASPSADVSNPSLRSQDLNASLMAALAEHDGRWATACLGQAASHLTGRELMVATWLLFVDGQANADEAQLGQSDGEGALAMLRRLIRSSLQARACDEGTVWVMPSGQGEIERTAAYLLVACLRMRDIDARPWLWAVEPTSGRCLRCGAGLATHGDVPRNIRVPVPSVQNIDLMLTPQFV